MTPSDTPLEKMIENRIDVLWGTLKQCQWKESSRVEYDLAIRELFKDAMKASREENEEENGTASCRLLWNRLDKWQKEWVAENPKERKLVTNDALKLIEWKIEKEKKASREEAIGDVKKALSKFDLLHSETNRFHSLDEIIKSLLAPKGE